MNKSNKLLTGIIKVIFVIIMVTSIFLQPMAAIRAGAGEGSHIYINVVANVVTVYYNGDPVRTMIIHPCICSADPTLTLALLVLRIFADNKYSAFSFNDFALVANRFY